MKNQIFYFITVCCLCILSCTEKGVNPETGFIKANINGVQTVYTAEATNLDLDHNYIKPGAINLTFNKDNTNAQYWSIDILFSDTTLDIDSLPLPFIISGPNPDFTGKSPEAHMSIINPGGAPYGELIAGASSFDHEFTLEITSIDNDLIKGTFSGIGIGKFKKGEFSAKLTRKNW